MLCLPKWHYFGLLSPTISSLEPFYFPWRCSVDVIFERHDGFGCLQQPKVSSVFATPRLFALLVWVWSLWLQPQTLACWPQRSDMVDLLRNSAVSRCIRLLWSGWHRPFRWYIWAGASHWARIWFDRLSRSGSICCLFGLSWAARSFRHHLLLIVGVSEMQRIPSFGYYSQLWMKMGLQLELRQEVTAGWCSVPLILTLSQ